MQTRPHSAVPWTRALAALGVAGTLAACAAGRTPAPAPAASAVDAAMETSGEPRELTADQQVEQALDRLTFGPRPGDAAAVRAIGVDRWIAMQLAPERIDDDSTDAFVREHFPAALEDAATLVRDYPPPQLLRRQLAMQHRDSAGRPVVAGADSALLAERARQSRRVLTDLQGAKMARAVMSRRQLQEVMVDFWENHFNIFAGKGAPERYLLAEFDRDAIRPHALGKFRDLLGAVARSPAMLFYLDNWESAADSLHPTLVRQPWRRAMPRRPKRPTGINENYARELMELHTLGVDGGYTQHDVIEVARALTGWSIDAPRRGGGFVFRPALHDAGPKVVLGHRLPAGRGIEDGEQVLDILAASPATAHFLSYELARRFVSDSPPPALVDRAARTYLATGGDIREVVRTIVTSPEFFSRAAFRSKVKSPFELVASAARAMGAPADGTPRTARVVARLGEPIFGHRDPDGWPETGDAWMNTGAILERINFGLAVAAGRLPGARVATLPALASLRDSSREAQVDAVVALFLGGAASPDTRQVLLAGANPLLGGRRVALAGLPQIVGLALGSPEFQRR